MKERIAYIMQEKSLSASSFADILGVQASGISHILSGRNNPSLDFIIRFLTKFPDVSSDWFILGNGSIYKSENSKDTMAGSIHTPPDEDALKQQINDSMAAGASGRNTKLQKHESDLFNTNDSSVAIPHKQQPQIDITIVEPVDKLNTNDDHAGVVDKDVDKPARALFNNKKIKRVMIFYSDNTVENYDYI